MYKKHSNRLKNMVCSKYNSFLNELYSDLDINPKKICGHVASKSKKGAFPDIMCLNGKSALTDTEKAELFNSFL